MHDPVIDLDGLFGVKYLVHWWRGKDKVSIWPKSAKDALADEVSDLVIRFSSVDDNGSGVSFGIKGAPRSDEDNSCPAF